MDERPHSRRYTVDVGAAGPESPVRFGDGHPSLQGWEISWQTAHSVNFAVVQALIHARNGWYQSALLEFGDGTTSPTMTQGGTVFAPFQFLSFEFFDERGVGGATVEIFGRPILCGDAPSRASSQLIATKDWTAAAAGTATIDVPPNASAYFVTRTELDASSIMVELRALNSELFDIYELDAATFSDGQTTPMPWRQTAWADAAGNGSIEIENNDAINQATGQVWFLFDLARGR